MGLMKRISVLGALVAALLITVLVGCGGGASGKYVGTWDTNLDSLPAVATFAGDGTFDISADIPVPQAQGAKMKILGTYKEAGEQLTVAFKDVEFENLPDVVKSQEAQMKAAFKQQIGSEAEETTPVKWEGDDKFSITTKKGNTISFARKK